MLGQFLSPDTLVPDAAQVLDYNRFIYARGNPVKYTDPTGHIVVMRLCLNTLVVQIGVA